MSLYLDYVETAYNDNKDNPIGSYFGIEWLKYAEPQRVDSFLNASPAGFRDTRRVKHYEEFARHRAQTAPRHEIYGFCRRDRERRHGETVVLCKTGQNTLWWISGQAGAPIVSKELPDMKQLYADYADKGFEIVGVAVRDKTDDTAAMVAKHELAMACDL